MYGRLPIFHTKLNRLSDRSETINGNTSINSCPRHENIEVKTCHLPSIHVSSVRQTVLMRFDDYFHRVQRQPAK